MSEQDGTPSSIQHRRRRKVNTSSQEKGKHALPAPRPANDDTEAWKAYWKAQGQPWRTEPEIDAERQKYLAERRSITPNIQHGIYPFKDIEPKLTRADVEWLLATHENGLGPVDWNNERQRERMGVDVRGADLRQADLKNLPMACLVGGLPGSYWSDTPIEQAEMAAVCLQGANVRESHLEGAYLYLANLEGVHLNGAHLEEAELISANLDGAELNEAHLEGAYLFNTRLAANLRKARLQRTHLVGTNLERAWLDGATLGDEKHIGPRLADVHWGANLAVVDWSQVNILGDEQLARQTKTDGGEMKDRETRLEEYEMAVRANRQLAIALLAQGLNEDAARFAYRAQCLQRRVLWFQMIGQSMNLRQRGQMLGAWLFSWFLYGVAGYGYKPQRCFYVYVLALVGFTLAHYIVGALVGSPLTFLNALAVSVQSLHGRLFSFQSSDPQTALNTIEAFVGLFIEAIVVAVITQRILGK